MDIVNIINTLQPCFIEIANLLRYSNSFEMSTSTNNKNKSNDEVKKLDFIANEILIKSLKKCKNIKYIASEEEDDFILVNDDGKYLVSFDPIDGSSNIKNNITVGTIFAIFKYSKNMSGKDIISAGYCLYGGSTTLILSIKDTTNIYLLNKESKFTILVADYKMPIKGPSYAINESSRSLWISDIIPKYINILIGENKTQRWVGSLVADAHRIITSGGVFMYPGNKNSPFGKIRLVYEAYPMAFVFKCCGGFSSNVTKCMLDLPFPNNLHQKVPILLFGKTEKELYYKIK